MDEEEKVLIRRIEEMGQDEGPINYTNILVALYRIPIQVISRNEDFMCSICLTEMEKNKGLELTCSNQHVYHINCIVNYFKIPVSNYRRDYSRCPMCRYSFDTYVTPFTADRTFVDGVRNVECVNFWLKLNHEVHQANIFYNRERYNIEARITWESIYHGIEGIPQQTKNQLLAMIEKVDSINKLNKDIVLFSIKKFETRTYMDMTTGMGGIWAVLSFWNSNQQLTDLKNRVIHSGF